jgi:hypothetical protein
MFNLQKFQVLILLLFADVCATSTPYHWECGTFTIDATDTMVYCSPVSTNYIYCTITNTGTAAINVRQIINSVNFPSGWSFNMCNPNACWGPNVLIDTFPVPAGSSVIARFDFHTDTTIGTGITSVRFDDSASPSINGATFNLHAVSLGTAIEETQNENYTILLYPNPVVNELGVRGSGFGDKAELTIFNTDGAKVYNQHLTSNIQRLTISVADLPSGIYFVKIKTEEGIRAVRFVKD